MSRRRQNRNQHRAKNVTQSAAALLGLGLVGGAVAWLAILPSPPVPTRFVSVVLDASPTNKPNRCADMDRLMAQALEDSRNASDLHLNVFATGDRTTGNQPVRLGAVTRVKGILRIETGHSGARDAEEHVVAQTVRSWCDTLVPRMESPIFQGVVSAMSQFQVVPCAQPEVSCSLVVRTDGIEEEDDAVVATLKGRDVERIPRLDNRYVDVEFCGISERHFSGRPADLPDVQEVAAAFRPDFSNTHAVRFLGTCASFRQDVIASTLETP
jgi:hypothetical protein